MLECMSRAGLDLPAWRPCSGFAGDSRGKQEMSFSDRLRDSGSAFRCFCVALALVAAGLAPSPSQAEGFEGPSFRKGLWHFVRTLELIAHQKHRHRILEREMTRCVDPTVAMKATFSSPSVGSCVSAKPEKSDNQYIFSNRCDYMGPVSTVITVQSDEAYTEVNELSVGKLPRVESVVANRVGDCQEDARASDGAVSH